MELLILFFTESSDLFLAPSFVRATWDCAHYPPDDFSGWNDSGPLVLVSFHVLHCTALSYYGRLLGQIWDFHGVAEYFLR